ncbi:MAG: 50S ribosomal protein L10 [Rikenellaceae bacterium]|jgi:large subunit ribosomal protein L10|nr:50S ribosomal protein L10 [Rikenellaceae bacterium]
MNKEEKAQIIEHLTGKLQEYPHFYLTDTTGLNAERTSALRRACFEKEIALVVVKNTLFVKALEKVEKADEQIVGILKGTTAVMFTQTGNAPAKLIKEFRKKSDMPLLKGAYVEECVYVGDNMLESLINVKSRDELLGDIIALLQSPAKNVISALQANGGQKIAGLVKALEERGA